MKRKIFAGMLVLALMMQSVTGMAAATTFKTVSNSRTARSWLGIPVYRIGVKGDYKTNRKKITGQSNARCNNATYYPGWSCQSKRARWVSKGAKSSTVRNNSTFFYGLKTQWITLGLQSYNDEINATVRP